MHNKAWIADNRIAIIGGRNVGDEYFGASPHSNFADLDVALTNAGVEASPSTLAAARAELGRGRAIAVVVVVPVVATTAQGRRPAAESARIAASSASARRAVPRTVWPASSSWAI